jgi:uncharacterized protein (DUF305 family)
VSGVRTAARRAVLPALLVLGLSGCTGGEEAAEQAADGDALADVTFARQSLVQHAETLLLVDEAAQGGVSPAVSAVVEEIRAERTADVEALTDLLEGWGEKVPATARDHAHAGHGPEDAAALRDERGAEFEEAWLDLMADRHEDALDLAETELEEGRDGDAVRLARDLVRRLTDQVAELERLEDEVED